jgi:HD-like signal output (HDOD) protein/ActR/RegA family two-component response regulator
MSDILTFNELKVSGVLPSPKGVALTIMKLCQRENVSLPELAHTIQADPVLAGRIIKIANVANPNKSRPIASVTTDTLILIGIHAVRQVVLGFSLVASYQDGACKAFNYPRYWTRSLAMASAAQAMGAAIRIAPPAELFTCGLLCGIGQLGLAAARPEGYSALLESHSGKSTDDIVAAEIERFGLSHRSLSSEMLADWGIPKLFTDAVLYHENPEVSGFAEGSRLRKLTYTLQLAAVLADIFLSPESARETLLPQLFQLGSTLGIGAELMVGIANQTLSEWNDWSKLLNIKTTAVAAFVMPEMTVQTETPEDALPDTHQPIRPMRILIADDDETLVFMLSKILKMAGHTVMTAKNGQQALKIATDDKPQAIVADWMMPELDGVALCKAIREQAWGKDIFYIILTSLEDESRQIEAFEAGVDAFLRKPFSPRLLNAKLMIADRRVTHNV